MDAINESLRRQSIAAHDGEVGLAAQEAEDGTALLCAMQHDMATSLPAEPAARAALVRALQHARSLALYNHLLLRYAFTAWAARRLEGRRRALTYDDRGRPTQSLKGVAPATAISLTHRGVL